MFVHLHSHSMFSTYDGYGHPEDRARHVKALDQSALAITDHGSTSGLIAHYHACKKHGIRPILGIEGYFQPIFDQERPRYHMTILVANMTGYRNVNQLMTIAAKDYSYRFPIITWEQLQAHQEGLIVLSGCLAGIIPQSILAGNLEEAERWLLRFQTLLGDRFYGEVMPFEDKENQQSLVNLSLIRLCQKHSIKVALTNDSHYTSVDDRETHQLMFQIKDNTPEADYDHLYLCSEDEVKTGWAASMGWTEFADCSPYVQTTQEIADRCSVELEFDEAIPCLEWDKPSRQKLADLCKTGLKMKGKYSGQENEKYRERLKYEFDIIDQKGYVDYFLLCYDIYEFARHRGIAYGLGRGSVCGSLLAYALGLTNVDPLLFGTNFERFLRPNKITLPDIDMDFESSRRQEIIDYLLEKYQGRAAPISTFGYYKVKNLANDLARCLGVTEADRKVLKSTLEGMISDEDAYALEDKSGVYKYLLRNKELQRIDREYSSLLQHFSRLFGQVRYIGRHAAGVAITEGPIENYCALIRTKEGLQTAYDLNDLGKINVTKVDILGLLTIDVIAGVERQIGKSYDIYEIIGDQPTYQAFSEGKTGGVFQFEGETARKVCQKVEPCNMMELIACNAMNRPAPLKFGLLDQFIAGKAGKIQTESVLYEHTQDTYGTLIYQEHVISLARWAGLDWGEVDKLVKGISKKTAGKDTIKEKFVAGCVEKGISKKEATALYEAMTLYLFNKGHGAGYSLLSFYTMFLKLHHPLEYWTALLRNEQKDEKRIAYEYEAALSGIGIWIPSVNGGASYELVADLDGDFWIRRGLSTIPGVGATVARAIEAAGPYHDETDLVTKLPKRHLTSKVMAALKESGALIFDYEKQKKQSIRYCRGLRKLVWEVRSEEIKKFLEKRKKKATNE